jgi:hypothetical protein
LQFLLHHISNGFDANNKKGSVKILQLLLLHTTIITDSAAVNNGENGLQRRGTAMLKLKKGSKCYLFQLKEPQDKISFV